MSTPEAKDYKIYEVTLRATGEKSYQAATNAEDACKQAGWLTGDCFIVEQKPRRKPVPDQETILLVKVPCQTCPFQYAECKKPPDQDCITRPEAPELQDWLKQATEAHLCPFIGKGLRKKDYFLGQKWVRMEEAILELSRKTFSPTNNSPHSTC